MKQNYTNKNQNNPIIRLMLLLLLVGGLSLSGWGQLFESFETGLPTSYSTVTEYELESGTWTGSPNQVIRGTQGVNSGSYSCQLRSQTGAQITTPTLVGGVGTISFYVTASTASGGMQVRISTDEGESWTQADGSPISFGTTTEFRTFEVNDPEVNKIQFYRTGATVYIDDVEITQTDVEFPTEGVIFIAEVADAPNFNDSYLELFNNSKNPINLSTSKLVMLSDGGDVETTWNLNSFSPQNIPPFGFFIITRGGDQEDFESQFGSINPNTVFVKGSGSMFFGAGTARRWQLWEGGTEGSADGNLIDDTQSAVAGNNNRTFQNIFDGTFTTDGRVNATPGELDYLLYNGGLWVNNEELGDNTGGENALIYDDLTISTNAAVNDLYIDANASVTINVNSEMDVYGDLISNAGEAVLVIKSDATGTGSLIHNSAGVQATVERFIEAAPNWPASEKDNGARGWHFLSAPVSEMTIIGSDFVPDEDPLPSDFDFYAFDQSADLPWINIRGQNGAQNDSFENNFVPGKGYLVAYQSTVTNEFIGELNVGSISIPLSHGDPAGKNDWYGWNLLGNPYASAIDWNDAVRTAFANEIAYIYDRKQGGGGDYIEVDGSLANAIIPAHQGFFVLANADPGEFTFTNDMRVHGDNFMKDQPVSEHIRLRITKDDFYSDTRIRIHKDAQHGTDRYDAHKLFSLNPNMPQVFSYTEDNTRVAINSIPAISDETLFTVGMRIPAEGYYTLSLQELTGAFATESIYLTDLLLDNTVELGMNMAYTFTATPDDEANRFLLHFSPTDDPTNIEEVDETAIQLWFSENTLFINSHEHNTALDVYDISGRRLQSHHLNAGEHRLDLNLPAGVYIVQSSGNSHHETMKIIIQ